MNRLPSRGMLCPTNYFLTSEDIFKIVNTKQFVKSGKPKVVYVGFDKIQLPIWVREDKYIISDKHGIQLEDGVYVSFDYGDD